MWVPGSSWREGYQAAGTVRSVTLRWGWPESEAAALLLGCPWEREWRRGMLIGMGWEVKPALRESRLVMIQLEPKTRRNRRVATEGKGKHKNRKNSRLSANKVNLFGPNLWKHVAVWKRLMATHAHDIWLNVRRESLDIIRKKLTMFLSFSPVGTVSIEISYQSVFIAESKGISSVVLPSDIHGWRG